MSDVFLVYVTAATAEEAVRIGKHLVTERLAACANVLPGAHSIYWWEGKVQDESEALLLLKTHAGCLDRLIQRTRELHSYSVPAVNAIRIDQGNPAFLAWVLSEAGAPG